MQLINRVIAFFKKLFAINDQITAETIAVKCLDLRNKAIETICQTPVTVLDILGPGYDDFNLKSPKTNARLGQFIIRHKKTGVMYIGQSRRIGHTLPEFISQLQNNRCSNPYLREFAENVSFWETFQVYYTLTPKFKNTNDVFNAFNEYNMFINVVRNGKYQYASANRAYSRHTQVLNHNQPQLQ